MSETTGLKASILAQSHDKGRLNLAAAKEQVEANFAQKKDQLILEKMAVRNSRLGEVTRQTQRETQQLENQARQSTLATKQAVLKELFEAAQAQMTAWSKEEQLAFFKQVMTAYKDKVSVIFGQLTKDKLSEQDLEMLQTAYPQVSFSDETILGEAGFVVRTGQVEDNYLYSSLVAAVWESDSYQLATEIFEN